jgi:putative restriction endonuclease
MLSIDEVVTELQQRGFQCPPQSGLKVLRFEHPRLSEPLYVKQSQSLSARVKTPLVLHPKFAAQLPALLAIAGVEQGDAGYYHNSNLRGFPKRIHTGATEVAYGLDLGFQHHAALAHVLEQLTAGAALRAHNTGTPIPVPVPVPVVHAAVCAEDFASTDTERDALIKARIGQGDYRQALLAYWGGCAVTDCTVPALLRASHIKPWREADGRERLDPYNGLLLTPNLDLAFDQGLITFDDLGLIQLSPELDPDSATALHLYPHLRLRQIEPRHCSYLAWHRKHLFRK